jgi:hypothetical protein
VSGGASSWGEPRLSFLRLALPSSPHDGGGSCCRSSSASSSAPKLPSESESESESGAEPAIWRGTIAATS